LQIQKIIVTLGQHMSTSCHARYHFFRLVCCSFYRD
jgi:hypothetical protein